MSILHEKQHDKIRWDFIDPGNLCVMVGTMKNALQCLSSQSIFLLFKTGHDLDVSKISPMYIFNERPYIQHICYIYCYIDSVTKLQDIEILIAVLVKYSLCKSKHKWQHHWPFFHHWPSCGSIFFRGAFKWSNFATVCARDKIEMISLKKENKLFNKKHMWCFVLVKSIHKVLCML